MTTQNRQKSNAKRKHTKKNYFFIRHINKKYSRVLFLVRYTYPQYLSFDYIVINSTLILVSDTWALRCKVWVPLNLDSKVTSNMTTSVYGDDYERIRRRLRAYTETITSVYGDDYERIRRRL